MAVGNPHGCVTMRPRTGSAAAGAVSPGAFPWHSGARDAIYEPARPPIAPAGRSRERFDAMIHYQVRCSQAHEFDGWFKDSAGFERQAARGLISCPVCGDTKIARALMAPALGRKGAAPAEAPEATPATPATPLPAPPAAPSSGPTAVAGQMPDHVRAMLQRLRGEVERNCDYVGPSFAEEARRFHNGEAPARGIYGETTPEQAEGLAEDGIGFSRIPWVPRADG